MLNRKGFTLLELIVVLAIIAVIIAIAVPSFAGFRRSALVTRDLAQIRSLQTAHFSFMTAHDGKFIDAGLAHGGLANEAVAWINTLEKEYGNALVLRSPLDTSPHWPKEEAGQGVPVPPSTNRFRRTSYGVNNYLTQYSPIAAIDPMQAHTRLSKVKAPSQTVHFLIMAFTGTYAGADHTHVESWEVSATPAIEAGNHVQTNAVSGQEHVWNSVSNYGFLDGHAETQPFSGVFQDAAVNRFNPDVSFLFARALDTAD